MRYWLTSVTLPMFLLALAVAGCRKDAPSDDTDAKVAKVDEPVKKQPERRTIPPIEIEKKEPEKKIIESKDPEPKILEKKEPEPKEIEKKEPEPKETEKKEPEPKEIEKKEPEPKGIEKKEPDPKAGDKTGTKGKNVEFKEPLEVMGKSFKDWLKEMKSLDPSRRDAAMNAVGQFGPYRAYEAVPDIMAQLSLHFKVGGRPVDLSVRVNGTVALSNILTNKPDPPPDAKTLKDAALIFKIFLKDDQVIMKVQALRALPSALPYSRDALDDVFRLVRDPNTWEVRREAVLMLGYLAPDAEGIAHPKAMPELRRIVHADPTIRDSAQQVRMAALQSIAMLAQDKVPPELGKALDDPSPPVRFTALNLLARMSPEMDKKDKEDTMVKLTSHLKVEKDAVVTLWTRATLMTVSKNINEFHMTPVVKQLKSSDNNVKSQALQVINAAGSKGKLFALTALLEAIEDPDPGFATAAMVSLVNVHALEAIPALEKLATSKFVEEAVQTSAANAVKALRSNEKLLNEKKDKKLLRS